MSARTKREGRGISEIVRPALRKAAHYAADKAIGVAIAGTRQTIKSVGLKGLANAVGSTSSQKKKQVNSDQAYGVIYARGKHDDPDNRGEQALLAYTEGATIYPKSGKHWLAFPTRNIPQRVGRRKITPALYKSAGLESSIGPLRFVPGKGKYARLVVNNVEKSRRTGKVRAVRGKGSRAFAPKKSITAFVLIKFTVRAIRFSQKDIVRDASQQADTFAREYLDRLPA